MLALGSLLIVVTRGQRAELRMRDGFLVTTAVWMIAALLTPLPLMLGPPHLSYVDAVYEVVSGLTTTGGTDSTAPRVVTASSLLLALAKRPNQAPLLSALQTTVAHQKKRQSQLGQSPEIGTPKAGTWTPMTPNQGDPIHDNYDRAIPMPGR